MQSHVEMMESEGGSLSLFCILQEQMLQFIQDHFVTHTHANVI